MLVHKRRQLNRDKREAISGDLWNLGFKFIDDRNRLDVSHGHRPGWLIFLHFRHQ